MTDIDPAARARGQAIRQSRLARARMIRHRIIGGSLALFVASFLLITIVLVSGHDPALARRSSATTVASTGSTTTGTSSSTSSDGSTSSGNTGNTGNTGSSASSSNGGTASSVTTSQS